MNIRTVITFQFGQEMFNIIMTSVSDFIENKYSENFSLDRLFFYDFIFRLTTKKYYLFLALS